MIHKVKKIDTLYYFVLKTKKSVNLAENLNLTLLKILAIDFNFFSSVLKSDLRLNLEECAKIIQCLFNHIIKEQ